MKELLYKLHNIDNGLSILRESISEDQLKKAAAEFAAGKMNFQQFSDMMGNFKSDGKVQTISNNKETPTGFEKSTSSTFSTGGMDPSKIQGMIKQMMAKGGNPNPQEISNMIQGVMSSAGGKFNNQQIGDLFNKAFGAAGTKFEQVIRRNIIKESVSPDDILELAKQYSEGKLDYAEFKSELQELEDRDAEYEIYGDESESSDDMNIPDEDFDELRTKRESIMHEDDLEECGGHEITTIPMTQPSKQQDNVNMNINMSGSGAGGIRDLLKVLRDLDGKDSNGGTSVELPFSMKTGSDGEMHGELQGGFKDKHQEEFSNSPNEKYFDPSISTHDGTDLNRSKGNYGNYPGGDNRMAVKERLESLYNYVKSK